MVRASVLKSVIEVLCCKSFMFVFENTEIYHCGWIEIKYILYRKDAKGQ